VWLIINLTKHNLQDAKYVVSDDILPDGFKIKKGDMINYVPYSMGRMTYLWGIDAEEFKPERWLQNGIFQPQSPFKFTAFQVSARNMIVNLLKKYVDNVLKSIWWCA
jgi:cytochrome P450